MTYATLMVLLEMGRSNTGLLKATGDLAERLQANVVAVAACHPLAATFAGNGYMTAETMAQDQAEIEREAQEAEAEFRDLLCGRAVKLQWRCASTHLPLADYVTRQARAADLILTAPDRGGSLLSDTRHVNIADLVMHAGRPVLLVPEGATCARIDQALVAWKESREARRAAADALPLLRLATHVTVVEVAAEKDEPDAAARLADVASWLASHGVQAEPLVRIASRDAQTIADMAQERQADLLVAGAYGHSRLREWILGGVTRDLLMRPARCTLLSH